MNLFFFWQEAMVRAILQDGGMRPRQRVAAHAWQLWRFRGTE